MIFYTADTHFGHANIIPSTGRPWKDVDEMNEALISAWNAAVSPEDDVYVLGDFCYRSSVWAGAYALRLNGTKHLLIGNHDVLWMKNELSLKLFAEAEQLIIRDIDGRNVTLCHYPLLEWSGFTHGAYHIHGHIHEKKNDAYKILKNMPRALNAGVDINGYRPVTFEELVENNARHYGR